MSDLDELAKIDINKVSHNEKNARIVKSRTKRRRSSAAAHPTVPLSGPEKRKNNGIPKIELEKPSEGPKKFSSLRDLLLFTLQASDNCPKYIKVKNRASLKSVVLVVIPGLDATSTFGVQDSSIALQDVKDVSSDLPFIRDHFKEMLLLSAPGDKDSLYPLLRTLAIRRFTKSEKARITDNLRDKMVILPDLRMNYYDLLTNGYPIHPSCGGDIEELENGWVDTVPFEHEGSHTFALDCEMCDTASGKALARISLIDFDENVIIDEYVKPTELITDYLTKYSGITEEILSGVTTTLQDVQEMILKTISSDDYLIGHSLENDLRVLKLRHPNIVDTSIIFEHPRGLPFKSSLKYLTKQHLGKVIQEGEHDSVEDSKACLDLVKLKLVQGALLGKVIDGQPIFDDLSKIEKTAVFIDQVRVQPNQNKYVECIDEDDVVRQIIVKSRENHLVVGNLRANPAQLASLNARLSKIFEELPPKTLFIVASGNGDQTEMHTLASMKKDTTENWSEENEEKLRKEIKQVRLGACFFKIV